MDFPGSVVLPRVISTLSPYTMAQVVDAFGGSLATSVAAWPTANLGIFVPLWLPAPFLLRYMFSINGTSAGNIDLALYSADATRIVSTGSTVMTGTSVPQIVAVTERVIAPGRYYMALAASSTSASFTRITSSVLAQKASGVAQATTQIPLAATPTLATVSNTYLPLFGIATINGF